MRLLLSLFLVIGSLSSLIACSCSSQPESFDLLTYDRSYDVLEVAFISVDKNVARRLEYEKAQKRFDSLRVEQEAGRYPKNIVPPRMEPESVLVKGRILRSFKGETDLGLHDFVTMDNSGSCGWIPQIGERYIIYVGPAKWGRENESFRITLCQRKISAFGQSGIYTSEEDILSALSEKIDGPVCFEQSIKHKEDSLLITPFIGSFLDGKREGQWRVYEPVFINSAECNNDNLLFIIQYKKGGILRAEVKNNDRYAYWLRSWSYHYLRKVGEKK